MNVIIPNVTAVRIKSIDGIGWQIGKQKYSYAWALVKATDGSLCDFTYAPIGTELIGDIVSTYRGHGFLAHDNKITRQESNKWNRDNWVNCFGNDNHFYGDIEFVTYNNPKSKIGKPRTDKFAYISIQNEVNLGVYRKNGKRNTMSIPIELVLEKHPYIYDINGNYIERCNF